MSVTLRSYRSAVLDIEVPPVVPPVGAVVVLLPVTSGSERTGALSSWSSGPAGLVATASIVLAREDVEALAGQRVWASVTSDEGVTVLEGVAAAEVGGAGVTLTGMLAIADERRRTAPRVQTVRTARVSLEARELRPVREARTVDLSRTGARLSMPAASLEGAVGGVGGVVLVEIEVVVGQDETITAGAEVLRVDPELGELAVRFVDLAEEDAERLDRAVLTELSAQRTTTST